MRLTARRFAQYKQRGEKIAMLTAYDFLTARLLDEAGVPALLVGDSLGMVMLGYDSTIPVTLDDVIRHTQAVVRGSSKALIIADLPFMTYTVSEAEALRNAGRLIQEGGAQAVKLEGGEFVVNTVRRLVQSGIPVMAHVGLTPQSVHGLGGFTRQGRSLAAARQLIRDCDVLQAAGAFAVVLEVIPIELARVVTERLAIPTIGIGAGPHCDGQVQVISDVLGLKGDFHPKHAKRYAEIGQLIGKVASEYTAEVQAGSFPTDANSFHLDEEVLAELTKGGHERTSAQ